MNIRILNVLVTFLSFVALISSPLIITAQVTKDYYKEMELDKDSSITPHVTFANQSMLADYLQTLKDNGEYQPFSNYSENLPTGYLPVDLDMAIVGGQIYIVMEAYSENNLGEIFLIQSHNYGENFSNPVNLSNDTSASFLPLIGVIGSNVYVVWQNESSTNQSSLVLASSMDGGRNFVVYPFTEENITTNANTTAIYKKVLLNTDGGYPYISWIREVCQNGNSTSNGSSISISVPGIEPTDSKATDDTENCGLYAGGHRPSRW